MFEVTYPFVKQLSDGVIGLVARFTEFIDVINDAAVQSIDQGGIDEDAVGTVFLRTIRSAVG